MESLFRMMFGTMVRAGIYKGMRNTRGASLVVIMIIGAIGYVVLGR